MSTHIIASITWPDGTNTRVWQRRLNSDLVFWTGPAADFPAAEDEYERYDDEGRVGIGLVDLRLDLLERHEEQMADSDRDLLAEIDAMLDLVRAAAAS